MYSLEHTVPFYLAAAEDHQKALQWLQSEGGMAHVWQQLYLQGQLQKDLAKLHCWTHSQILRGPLADIKTLKF